MKLKYLCVLSLPGFMFLGVGTAFSQSSAGSVTLNVIPSRSVGQPQLAPVESQNPNLVEGRELFQPSAIAFDVTASPPILYVSDTYNNRVLAWKNSTAFSNGQPADLVVGQTDKNSTRAWGPGTNFSTLLNQPTGIAVDKAGNLYVADNGNNRVLRYPKPFAQTSQYSVPDLVIGQPSFSVKTANYTGAVSAQGISLSGFLANLTFDANGNLWMSDPGNRRVLEFQASDISSPGAAVSAHIVIGQQDFVSQATPLNPSSSQAPLTTNQLAVPSSVAFDPQGNLYITDTDNLTSGSKINRVLVFAPPFTNGQGAARIMGVIAGSSFTGTIPAATVGAILLSDPEGVFFLPDGSVGVADTGFNRILIFPPYAKWPDPTVQFSPSATVVLGQTAFTNGNPNGNIAANLSPTIVTPPANAASLWRPLGTVFLSSTNELFIADSANNRVIVCPMQSGDTFGSATRVLGQDRMTSNSVNLIEGREFFYSVGAGIALDTTGSVPHMYVADPGNHRVLGFYDVRKMKPGAYADLVIGQPDFNTALCNNPTGDASQATDSSLCSPDDVLVDPQGNLYVADTGNGRVLRFPAPFGQCPGGPGSSNCNLAGPERADLVLGQQNFFGAPLRDPSNTNMSAPFGLAFSGSNGLLVADAADNRVLYIPFSANGTFVAGADNGKAATKVYGQPDFITITKGSSTSLNQLTAPRHIGSDTSGLVYVTDPTNSRVLIFSDPNSSLTPASNTSAILTLGTNQGLNTPEAVYVNPSTGEIWIANSGQGTCVRFPNYDTLALNPKSTGTVYATDGTNAFAPLAVLQDQYGDLFMADSSNRVAVYFQGLIGLNGASFFANVPLAPGAFASLCVPNQACPNGTQFGANTASGAPPFPGSLGGIQVTVNGTPAPLTYVSPGQINLIVPQNAPTSGTANFEVVQVSTGQVLGAYPINMSSVSPAIFETTYVGTVRQAAVINEDGTINSQSNPAQRGHIISIYATGQGVVPNMPADGVAPTGLAPTPMQPRVAIGTCFVDSCPTQPGDPPSANFVQYSGLSPNYPGLWQINVYVPMVTAPGQTLVGLVYNNVFSNAAGSPYQLAFWVK